MYVQQPEHSGLANVTKCYIRKKMVYPLIVNLAIQIRTNGCALALQAEGAEFDPNTFHFSSVFCLCYIPVAIFLSKNIICFAKIL